MDGDSSGAGVLDQPGSRAAPARPPAVSPAQDVPIGPDAGIMTILATTRAMRHLAPDPVPDELIRSVIQAATWAPSGGNSQVARYLVVTDREVMARLAPLWGRAIDDYRLILRAGGVRDGTDESWLRMRAAIDYQREHFAEIPALIVICQEPGAYAVTRSTAGALAYLVRRVGFRRTLDLFRRFSRARRGEAGAIYPGVQNLLLAARAHGLAACLTSWHLFVEDEFKAVIGIPKDVRTWAIIPIGWPLRRFGPVRRRPVDEVIRRERW
jgi:nitroreductase